MAKDVAARFARTALDQRSAPYRWLAKNHAKIAPEIAKQKRPTWKALALTAADSGVVCSPDTLRKAWLRLEADLEFRAGRRSSKPAASVKQPVQRAQPSPQPETAPPTQPAATDPSDDIRSRLAKGRQVPKPIF